MAAYHHKAKYQPLGIILPESQEKLKSKPQRIQDTTQGFSLLELIVVVAGLAVLTSIASTALNNMFSDLENDEVQAHLNSLAADCLKKYANLSDSDEKMPPPDSIDTNLLDKNNYEENNGNTCKYFLINPKDTTSKTHFSMGFGIAYGRVTKFAIKDSAKTTNIEIACKSWASEGNCLDSGSDYSSFFDHMDNVRIARAKCNINLKTYITDNPDPPEGGSKKTWDSNSDKDCRNKILPTNASSYETTRCKTGGCTVPVKIKNGRIVGTGDTAGDSYDEYVKSEKTEACNSDISNFLKNSYTEPTESFTSTNCKDEDGDPAKIYLCDEAQMNKSSYDKCYMDTQIYKCNVSLDEIRKESDGEYTVGGKGLPPCGQKVWVCKNIIYETEVEYTAACKP